MSYVRPPVLTAGDIVKGTYMSILRADWAAYESHAHSGDGTDGASRRVVHENGA